MNLRSLIKKDALLAVKSNWTAAVFLTFFFLLVDALFFTLLRLGQRVISPAFHAGFVERVMDLLVSPLFYLYFFLWLFIFLLRALGVGPMSLSRGKWYYHLSRGKVDHVHILFRNYKTKGRFFKALRIYICHFLIRGGLLFVVFLPPLMGLLIGFRTFFMAESNRNSGIGIGILVVGFLFLPIAVLIYAYFASKFFLMPYLFYHKPNLPVGQYIKRSAIYMKGREGELLGCMASFLPAFLSCVLVFPLFVVIPHFLSTLAIYARYFIEQNEMQKPAVYRSPYA